MPDRPYTLLSCSVSLDGYLGDRTPRLALSNEADFDRVDAVRASCDAIMVGAVTVRLGPVATIVDGGRRVRMRWLSEELADRGVERLMVEGGGGVHTQFLA